MSQYIVWGLRAKEVKSVDSYGFYPSFFLSKTPFPFPPSPELCILTCPYGFLDPCWHTSAYGGTALSLWWEWKLLHIGTRYISLSSVLELIPNMERGNMQSQLDTVHSFMFSSNGACLMLSQYPSYITPSWYCCHPYSFNCCHDSASQ